MRRDGSSLPWFGKGEMPTQVQPINNPQPTIRSTNWRITTIAKLGGGGLPVCQA